MTDFQALMLFAAIGVVALVWLAAKAMEESK